MTLPTDPTAPPPGPRLLEAFDALDAGVVLFDAEDRLVLCNRHFRALYAPVADLLVAGVRFETLLRAGLQRGLLPESAADPETFVAERLRSHHAPGEPVLRRMADGRWRRITERRLGDGSLLAYSVDVTESIEKTQALDAARREAQRSRERLEDAVAALPAGFELYDADDRLVLANETLRTMYPNVAAQMAEGWRFEDLVRRNIAAGDLPDIGPDPEAWLAARLAARRQPGTPIEQRLQDGRWVRIHERRTRDGGLVAVRVDMTELRQQRAAAELAAAQLEDAIDALSEGFALYDSEDRLVVCNRRYREIYALSAPAMQPGTRFEAILRYGLARGQYPAAVGQEQAWLEERLHRHRHPGPSILQELPGNRWLRIEERSTRQGGVAGVRTDVSELVQREQQLQQANARLADSRAQLHAVISTAPSAILILDAHGTVLSANPATTHIFGWGEPDLLGRDVRMLFPADAGPTGGGPFALLAATADPAAAPTDLVAPQDVAARHRDGRALIVEVALSRLAVGGAPRHVALLTDVTERVTTAQALREANAQLEHLSETDALTGIANRRRFDRLLQEEWMRATRHGQPLALLMIDVDHFKRYNDRLGHPRGDACLRAIAQALQRSARRAGDLAARYGGEEFALLLPHTGPDEALALAQACRAALAELALPHPDSPIGAQVTLSIGVAATRAGPDGGPKGLLDAADAGVYAAKRAGRDRAVLA